MLEDIDPSLPDSRKLTQPHAEYMDLVEVNKDDGKAQSTPPGADYIGKGAFGQVAKGTAVGLGSPETTTVAIKMLKSELLYCKLNESWPTDIQEMLPGYCNYLAICHFISYVVIPTFRILFPLTKFYFLFLTLQQTLLNRTREI